MQLIDTAVAFPDRAKERIFINSCGSDSGAISDRYGEIGFPFGLYLRADWKHFLAQSVPNKGLELRIRGEH